MTSTRSSGPSNRSSKNGHQVVLDRVLAGQAELLPPLGQGVFHPQRARQAQPDLVALGLGDPALRLEHSPGDVVLLGPDQAEDVFLAVVLADQGRRQARAGGGPGCRP